MQLPESFFKQRRLETLVENQTSYTLENAALHVFETHKQAEHVLLQFDNPVLASMLKGKKIMHLKDHRSFDFLPGESLILPSDELMCIDFPEARENSPTRCLAMAISDDLIKEVISFMNDKMPKCDQREWSFLDYNFHFTNDIGIHQILQRLLFLFTEAHPSKDYFVNNMLKELIIRIMQTNSNKIYTEKTMDSSKDGRLSYIIEYIRKNLQKSISVMELSKKAYMSESNFHRVFKNELGMSPVDFINNERIKLASSLLQDPNLKIKEVFMRCGFENRSYFNRLFKRIKNVSPREYQKKIFK
ncbi:transcriptional regulator, AraC family [Zhouia amylolytica]|uniref:Transcriptional regulator, AraC family n=1 Tax=Zhouia amylolytica TaxID=376730 RepID=A0A1I6UHW7_9FLAO|nr:AraC family transcriptional regulator [Zhouia amylolytica]SFT01059.1 transcriptional regulator, AraC family [Zhouia amylolytica]